jgi:hypothetical protein
MSEFSLAPKPCSLQLTPASIAPVHDDAPVSVQMRDSMTTGATLSSPGISIPSVDDSWFAEKDHHSTPAKEPLSSEDELNLFLPMHYPPFTGTPKRSSAKVADDVVLKFIQPLSIKRIYGKKRSRKSVTFASDLKRTTNGDTLYLYV